MLKSTAKADAIANAIAANLKLRLAGSAGIDTVAQARDSQGWPMVICSDAGAVTAGNPVIAIRIRSADLRAKDSLGNAMAAFSPHVAEVAYELDGASGTEPTRAEILAAEAEVLRTGTKLQLKEIADGVAVNEASMDNAAVVAQIDDIYWPNSGT